MIEILLNGLTPDQFWAFIIIAYFGLVVNVAVDVAKRKPESRTSPKDFEWEHFFQDNWRRLLVSILFVPAGILLFTYITGTELNLGNAFMIGFAVDKLVEVLKHKKIV